MAKLASTVGSRLRPPRQHELRYATELSNSLAQALPDPQQLVEQYGAHALDPVWVSFAPQKFWCHWIPVQIWQGHFLRLLANPYDKPKEELPLFMPGRLVGTEQGKIVQRLQANVWALSFCVLDYDKGDAAFDAVIARLIELGLCATVYRSPSDGKEITKIRRTGPDGKTLCEPTVEACLNKLIADGFSPAILGDVQIIDDHLLDDYGTVWIVVHHNPIAKTRVVIVLAEPFTRRPGESSRAFALRWRREVMEPLAHALGFAADTARFDTNGAFYLPRLLDGVGSRYVPGDALDLNGDKFAEWQQAWEEPRRRLEAERRARVDERRTAEPARVHANPINKRYALGDLIWDCANERVRADKRDERDGLIECECPFDELHSNAGDESDSAFFVTNSGAAGCLHSHKDDHCVADYIAKMLADGWFSADRLEAYVLPPRTSPSKTDGPDLYAVAYGL
ncbi:MAG: hypothetical protein K8F92_02100 [Hyphomicrobium sp.]|uniref:hypothetical protein n=1 Tax=Hyphomicrobium sp. TaxID=82 RepID=UPI00132509D3|nr:hypothetical protein [Hyphomicrobium sp.]KAB2942289.1 MAG: hypothetical protein F9K20_07065 [Hyphomicrobium sp.]MBZ0208433.1 hypothetical protein [Hyphomicrobium sp.]